MEWSGLTRIGSSPLQIHIGFVSSHAKQIEHRKLSSGARHHRSRCAGAAMHGHRSGTSSIMEPGVANREGKGAIKRRRMRKVIHSQNSVNPPGADHKVTRPSTRAPGHAAAAAASLTVRAQTRLPLAVINLPSSLATVTTKKDAC